MENEMLTFQEFRERISIIELATAYGYILQPDKGKGMPVMYNSKHDDMIVIVNPKDSSSQGFFNERDKTEKGTLITFIQNRLGDIFPADNSKSKNSNVNAILYKYLNLDPFTKNQIQEKINVKELSNVNTKSYNFNSLNLIPLRNPDFLISRGIAPGTLSDPIFKGSIKSIASHNDYGVFYNTAFPYTMFDDKQNVAIVGAEVRNFNNFKGHADGSNKINGLWHSIPQGKVSNFIFNESGVDSLSHHQLNPGDNKMYLSLGGSVSLGQLNTFYQLQSIHKDKSHIITLANDNDKHGANHDLVSISDFISPYLSTQFLSASRGFKKISIAAVQPTKDLKKIDFLGFADNLLSRLSSYNSVIDHVAEKEKSPLLQSEIKRDQFVYGFENNQLVISFPYDNFAVKHLNQSILEASGFDKMVKIDKSILKDFNDDLQLLQGINVIRKADNIGELSYADFKKDVVNDTLPKDYLNYCTNFVNDQKTVKEEQHTKPHFPKH